jgi:methionine sulfoxide reductase heme-binding subunit
MGILLKNTYVGVLGALFSYGFWLSRPDWDAEMRFWRAVGDGSLMLLVLALVLGPLARLWPVFGRWLSYRRELGVWFGLFALLHTLLVWNGWARWDVLKFLGYEFIPELNRVARLEPGFGLANLVGLVAMLLTLVLMATSTDYAIRRLGGGAWKFLLLSAYIVFYLVVLHTVYFLFMHYTQSFHRTVPEDPNWFRVPFLVLTALVIVLQGLAYIRSLNRPKQRQSV